MHFTGQCSYERSESREFSLHFFPVLRHYNWNKIIIYNIKNYPEQTIEGCSFLRIYIKNIKTLRNYGYLYLYTIIIIMT